ncbi:MAG: hypothetical protein ACRDFC_01580 [Ignavibacteria bacterium]
MKKLLILTAVGLFFLVIYDFYGASVFYNNANVKTAKNIYLDSGLTDIELKLTELKGNLTDDFTVEKFSYFIIASNLTRSETKSILENTISRAVDCFYNGFFEKRPDDVTIIFLFKDDESYRYWANKLYDDEDLSRFGYYKPSKKVMLMNISTGTGTLVHEMTHALVAYDFPDIPAWFNEGLGSLYERCSLNNREIIGYVNWRLPTLQEAISKGTYTSLDKLLKTDDDLFYGSRSDFNYSQARYLCMYLQEKGLLKKYYRQFREKYGEDKTGKKFMEELLNKKLDEIEEDYIKWVGGLKYE